MASLLVVHHSPTGTVRAVTDAVVAGARHEDISGVEVVVRPALEASAEDVLGADGYLLVTPANFGYMSGALKHFFDSLFLHVGGSLADDGAAVGGAAGGGAAGGSGRRRPFGLAVHGRYDTTGAVRSVLAITGALPWQQAAPVLELLGDLDEAALEEACELGGTLAALLSD